MRYRKCIDRGTTLAIVGYAMTEVEEDFWREHARAEDALALSVSQLTLSLDLAIDEISKSFLSYCTYNSRTSAERNAFYDHWRRCSGCSFCGESVLQQ